jgi:hypothetical protein
MRNSRTTSWHLGLFLSKNQSRRTSNWLTLFLLTLFLTALGNRAQAETAQSAPAQLKNLLVQIDAAANNHDLKTVMRFYSQNFTNSDGLTRSSIAQALTQLWQRYPQLKYQTQLQSWKPEGNTLVAQTVTNITNTQSANSKNTVFNSTIQSQQRVEGQKILRQDILSERSQLSAGAKPPTVDVKLPTQVTIGQHYNFDAIVQQPLGDDYLLGAAIEEPVQAEKYLKPSPVQLQLLEAGGLFKMGQAPVKPGSLWVSGVLIGSGGMTVVTQRLQVVSK